MTIAARLFAAYLNNLPIGLLELSSSSTRLSIRCERTHYDFHAIPADVYPPLTGALRAGIAATVFAVSIDKPRGRALSGVLCEVTGDTLTLIATDGYRLAAWSGALVTDESSRTTTQRFIVPSKALVEAAANLISVEMVEITVLGESSSHLALASETADASTIVVRLIDDQYPRYEQVIPVQFICKLIIETETLRGALKRAQLMSADRASKITLSIESDRVVITADSSNTGNAREEIPCDVFGKPLALQINARFVVDILSHIDAETTIIELVGPRSPLKIRPANTDASQFYVLMPLQSCDLTPNEP